MQSQTPSSVPVVQLRGVVKRFPGVLANDHVDLDLYPGEVHSLLGENGAGKTTLMNILYGLYQADQGEIWVKGKQVRYTSAQDAIRDGLEMVHQHFQLVNSFTVAENVTLGQRSSRGLLLEDKHRLYRRIEEISNQFGLNVDPGALVWQLSVGEQQRVEILKTLYRGADVLILDEPTAVLTPQESQDLLRIIRSLADQGRAVVFISHKLNEVLAVSDRITVLRDGHVVSSVRPCEQHVDRCDLARMMVGRDVLLELTRSPAQPGDVCVSIEDLWLRDDRDLMGVKGITLDVHQGEIVGLAGVAGNGQRELEEALRGLRPIERGHISICGSQIDHSRPADIIRLNVSHIPSDRYGYAMLDDATVAENLVLERFWQPPFTRGPLLDFRQIVAAARQLIEQYDVRTPSANTVAGKLSGGNAQKMVLARELSMRPAFLLAAEPTRGLDVSAIEYVHRTLLEQRQLGTAILLISTDLEEIFALSDRIAVIYEGQILDIVPGDLQYMETVGLLMAGTRPGNC